jgi:hypothetical protein
MCGPAWNAIRNVRAAAVAQGQLEWWESVQADAAKLRAVVSSYHVRVSSEVTGLKRAKKNSFCIAQYRARMQKSNSNGTFVFRFL